MLKFSLKLADVLQKKMYKYSEHLYKKFGYFIGLY